MLIAGSFLKIQNDQEKIKNLNDSVDYIHFDIMDGKFTTNKTLPITEMITNTITKPKDIHLMVEDVKSYIDEVLPLNPHNITFHIEVQTNHKQLINYLKKLNIKIGLAINPETEIEKIIPYLSDIDLVLVMSVHPGKGGQPFIDITDKIDKLIDYRQKNNLKFLIEVDGGINNKTIKIVKNVDIAVVGSYITDSDNYHIQVQKLKESIYE